MSDTKLTLLSLAWAVAAAIGATLLYSWIR